MDFLTAFAGQSGIPALLTLILVLIVLYIATRKDLISFNGKGLRIGQDQDTRNLIQSQFEYAKAKVEGMTVKLPNHLNIHHTKYILARVEDVIQRAIIFNNMSTNEDYVKAKQELVYQTVMKRVTDDWFKTDDFKAMCYKFTADLIEDLVRMKRIH